MKIAPIKNTNNTNFKANKMSKTQAQYFKDRIKNAQKIDIVCHESTDRDALNSAIAIQRYAQSLKVPSRIIISQNLQKIGIKQPNFKYIQAEDKEKYEKPVDTTICVDFSAKERVSPEVLSHIEDSNTILCIDHHRGTNLFTEDYAVLKQPIENPENIIQTAVPCYVDSSAKSATSIIYRMFEALDEPISNEQAYSLMFGFVDDAAKRGLVTCDGKKGLVEPTQKLVEDKNALDVFLNLEEKLTDEQIGKIASAVDIMSNLTPLEKEFKNSLHDKIKLSDNGKIAYVEIPPKDKEWQRLGADNSRTSTILNRFRQNVLQNRFKDEKLNNVELVMVFYEAEGKYRLSAHSKNSTFLDFCDYVEQTRIPNFTQNAGGHKDRGGGKIFTTDPKECHKWVNTIISCSDFYD